MDRLTTKPFEDEELKSRIIAGMMLSLPPHREITEIEAHLWLEFLGPYPVELVSAVAAGLFRTCAFMPSPAAFVAAIEGDPQERSLRAWIAAFNAMKEYGPWRSICFDDPAIHYAIDQMGGWTEFGNWDEKDRPFREKQFRELYSTHRPSVDRVAAVLPGYCTLNQGGAGVSRDNAVLIATNHPKPKALGPT